VNYEQRYWSAAIAPLTDHHGNVTVIIVSGTEATSIIRQLRAPRKHCMNR
jgi:hypothetical protein